MRSFRATAREMVCQWGLVLRMKDSSTELPPIQGEGVCSQYLNGEGDISGVPGVFLTNSLQLSHSSPGSLLAMGRAVCNGSAWSRRPGSLADKGMSCLSLLFVCFLSPSRLERRHQHLDLFPGNSDAPDTEKRKADIKV